jgi:hypothetical protein
MCPAIIDTRDARGSTALMTAASMSHLLVVRRLIDSRAAVNSPDYKGRTPLITAVGVGAFEVVAALCAAGANLALTGDRGRSALHAAVEYNSVDIVRVLIEHGVNINAQDAGGRTALHIAVDSQVSQEHAAQSSTRQRFSCAFFSDAHAARALRSYAPARWRRPLHPRLQGASPALAFSPVSFPA